MPPRLPEPMRFWTPGTIAAVALAAIAVLGSAGAFLEVLRADRMIRDIGSHALLVDASLRRSMACMDGARGSIGAGAGLDRADKMLNISKGITLCLVQARQGTLVDTDLLARCIDELEAANLIVDAGDGADGPRPAC